VAEATADGARHEDAGLARAVVVVGGLRAGDAEAQQLGCGLVVVQVVAMVFLPDARIGDLHRVLRPLEGQRIAPTGAGVHGRRRVGQGDVGHHGAAVQVKDAQCGGRVFGHGQAACGVDACVLVGTITAAAAATTAARGQGQNEGQRQAALKG
jgi:hypothetical protein